jgi:hypothetical protein
MDVPVLRPFSYTNHPGNCQLFSAIYHNHVTLAYSENGYVGKFVAPQKRLNIVSLLHHLQQDKKLQVHQRRNLGGKVFIRI